jgi:hypothetical protein
MQSNICTPLVLEKALTASGTFRLGGCFFHLSAFQHNTRKEFYSFIVTFSQLQFINMKKMFAKLGMPSLLTLAFLLCGMFFGSSLQAQTLTVASTNTGGIKVNANWKTSGQASTAFEAAIAQLDQTLSSGLGTPSTKMTLAVYTEVKALLESGLSVPEAAITGYNKFAPGGADRGNDSGLSQGEWTNIYNGLLSVVSQ